MASCGFKVVHCPVTLNGLGYEVIAGNQVGDEYQAVNISIVFAGETADSKFPIFERNLEPRWPGLIYLVAIDVVELKDQQVASYYELTHANPVRLCVGGQNWRTGILISAGSGDINGNVTLTITVQSPAHCS